jgi:predicted RNA-binding Zn ribbon-like protein
MDFSHYDDQSAQTAVDLINTLDAVSGEEKLSSPQDVTRFIRSRHGDWCEPGWEADEADLLDVRDLRSRLREVFDATNEAEAVKAINAVLHDSDAVPRLSLHGERVHLHFEAENGSPSQWLGAVTAMGLTTAIIKGGYERFGRCNASTCDDAFVDISRNGSRRRCSDTCATRENVAAHRARLRQET